MLELSNLELTKLCAKAMGIILCERHSHTWPFYFDPSIGEWGSDIRYDPLHDDAQAMALVKKFRIDINYGTLHKHDVVTAALYLIPEGIESESKNLNHAIVECVAKMQKAK